MIYNFRELSDKELKDLIRDQRSNLIDLCEEMADLAGEIQAAEAVLEARTGESE